MPAGTKADSKDLETVSGPLRSVLQTPLWLNTSPLHAEDLRGKVVLVNFWTYTCINSIRPLPYLRAWAEKYKDQGLVVIGVHTPEFLFERDQENVSAAVTELSLGYPVAMDSDYDIWQAFSNNAWPGFYFIDATGRLRHRVIGESGYDESERWIQKLLKEAADLPVPGSLVAPSGTGAEAPPDWANVRTRETYLGFARATNFASPGGAKRDVARIYVHDASLARNRWILSGNWKIGDEYASLEGASGSIALRFHARDLHLVLGKGVEEPIRFRVTLDGKPPGADHGTDIDAEGWGLLDEERMYQLVRQSGSIQDRVFEVEFLDQGARGYAFTFG